MASATERGPRIGKRIYAVAIFAILIAEFPLNAIAFRLFGEAEVLTWVMTASLAVTLVLCAHGLGTFLRQPHPSMAERRWVMVLITLPVLAIVAIALIRARYLAVAAELTGLDTLGPVVGSAAFLIINLLVYTGATMLSYLAHAPKDRAAEERAAQTQQMADAQQELTFATRRVREQEARVARSAVAVRAGAALDAGAGRPDDRLLPRPDGRVLHGEHAGSRQPGGARRAARAPGDRGAGGAARARARRGGPRGRADRCGRCGPSRGRADEGGVWRGAGRAGVRR